MSDSLEADIQMQLELLRARFAADLPQRLDMIGMAVAACQGNTTDRTALSALVFELHSMGGAAGVFGFMEMSDQAIVAEQQVERWLETGCSAADLDIVHRLVEVWRRDR